jgi:hypothetical protein
MTLPRISFLAAMASALALGGCGSAAGKRVTQQLAQHSIAPAVRGLPSATITNSEIQAAPSGSPSRAFLSMWSDLQWQSWPGALSYFPVGMIDYIGGADVLQAFEFNAALYRTSKPKIEEQSTTAGRATIRYVLMGKTPAVPMSIVWTKVEGRWMVYYDAELNGVLASWAQVQTQQALDPTATTPSAQALAAGARLEGAQSRYLASHR